MTEMQEPEDFVVVETPDYEWRIPADAMGTYLDFKGDGLRSLQECLDRLEQEMASMGARIIEVRKSAIDYSAITAAASTSS
jgi:hypothetical protein